MNILDKSEDELLYLYINNSKYNNLINLLSGGLPPDKINHFSFNVKVFCTDIHTKLNINLNHTKVIEWYKENIPIGYTGNDDNIYGFNFRIINMDISFTGILYKFNIDYTSTLTNDEDELDYIKDMICNPDDGCNNLLNNRYCIQGKSIN